MGIGLLINDNVAAEEEVLEQTCEGRPYECPPVRVFEVGDDGKIRRLHVSCDRLGMEQQVAMQYPGIMGWGLPEADQLPRRTNREGAVPGVRAHRSARP